MVTEHYGGDVGLAITQAVMLTGMLQWGIRQSAEMENHMTAVERVLEYTDLEKEPPLESQPGEFRRRYSTFDIVCTGLHVYSYESLV
jgi:hypothetical protein